MANIRTVETQEGLGLRPSEIGVEATAAAARRGGSFFRDAAEATNSQGTRIASAIRDAGEVAVKFEDAREISKGAADGAQFVANWNNDWRTMLTGGTLADGTQVPKADPNDPELAAKFRQRMEQGLEQFRGNFNTERSRQWAEHFIDKYREHMFAKTAADMSTMAGIAVQDNARKAVNALSSAVAADPSSLDFALDAVGHKIGGMADSSPNLAPEANARVKSEVLQSAKEAIVKAAISGMIQKNPGIDLDAIQKKYGDYINGAEMKMFQKAAQTQAKADLLTQKQLETYQRQQQERQANDAFSKVVTDNFTAGPDGKLAIDPKAVPQTLEILKRYPEAGAAAARTMIDFVESQQNKGMKAIDDPGVVKDLSDRMFSVDRPTTTIDLMRARTQGKISDHTFTVMNSLVKEMQESPLKGPVYQDTMKAVHDALIVNVPGIPGRDTVGSAKYAQFVQAFIPQYLAKSRAGTLEPNALDVNDPNSMISKAMEPFKRTPQQRMQDYMSGLEGLGASKAAPKEPPRITSKAEYDKLDKGTVYISAKDGQRYEKQ